MARTVKEWIGKNDDDEGYRRKAVRLRILERQGGKCAICGRAFGPKLSPEIDHVRSLKNSKLYPGENLNRESNLQALCEPCHETIKTPQDRKEQAEVARFELKQYGLDKKTRKHGALRKKMNGIVEMWDATLMLWTPLQGK